MLLGSELPSFLFAYGPGAKKFTGIYENTDIFWNFKKLLIKKK
jgi:alkaline phosphatase